MSQKKSTRKGSSASTVEDRARAIVKDVKRYDEETRHAINNMLRENSKDLAEMVRRAERGEEIFDLVRPLTPPASLQSLAGHLSAVMRHPLTPVELFNAMQDELGTLAAEASRHQSPDYLFVVLRDSGALPKSREEGGRRDD
jgi:hypothetical protein